MIHKKLRRLCPDSLDYNVVVKADGLAAGKGVIVCNSPEEAISAIETILVKKTFGDAGNRIIIEETDRWNRGLLHCTL